VNGLLLGPEIQKKFSKKHTKTPHHQKTFPENQFALLSWNYK